VEKQVSLREEKVIVERRKPAATSSAQDTLTEKSVEMTDTFEVVNAWKSVRVLEEVVLRKEVTERVETVRDTVRRDEIEIERPNVTALPRRNTKA
jgi:stress response protein YsnF